MMFSRAARIALICAFALALVTTWGQVRSSLLGGSSRAYLVETQETKENLNSEHDCQTAIALGVVLELAPDFAALAEISVLAVDAEMSVAVPKRGPPSANS